MYSKEEKIVIWFSTFDFMAYKKVRYILDNIDNLTDMFDNIKKYENTLSKVFEKDEINAMIDNNNLIYVDRIIVEYDKLGIDILTVRSEKYPENLKQIDSYPIMLYCKGDINLLSKDCLGVVGTRRATKYGKDIGCKLVKDIASENVVIVSGLADGIDTVAHSSTLEVGGKTIAVLGGGLLNIYPAKNEKLALDIINNGGLLISEYKPSEQALTYHFPIRNRIIAGLSKGVLIVEATENSGSMHTKNYAIDYGKEVFAVPGRIGDIYSEGCNKVIANGQARIVLSSQDILDIFNKSKKNEETMLVELSFEEQLIYDSLYGHEKHIDELVKETKLDTKVLLTYLMRMEIKGVVTKLSGNYYKLKI